MLTVNYKLLIVVLRTEVAQSI